MIGNSGKISMNSIRAVLFDFDGTLGEVANIIDRLKNHSRKKAHQDAE